MTTHNTATTEWQPTNPKFEMIVWLESGLDDCGMLFSAIVAPLREEILKIIDEREV